MCSLLFSGKKENYLLYLKVKLLVLMNYFWAHL